MKAFIRNRGRIGDLAVRVARDGPGRPLDDVACLTLAFGDGSTALARAGR